MAALNITAGTPRLFRTYSTPKYETFNCTIWEAARATSAGPNFFKRIVIGDQGSQHPYIGGGMGCNNPIMQVLEEAELIFPSRHVACIISIGTGQPQTTSLPTRSGFQQAFQQVLPLDIMIAMRDMAASCERSAREIATRFQGISNVYFRFNVEQGLQNVGLAQWEKLEYVTAHTEDYLHVMEVDQKLGAAVTAIQERQNVVPIVQISMEPVKSAYGVMTDIVCTFRSCCPITSQPAIKTKRLPSSNTGLYWKAGNSCSNADIFLKQPGETPCFCPLWPRWFREEPNCIQIH
jgi:hypothetical protein